MDGKIKKTHTHTHTHSYTYTHKQTQMHIHIPLPASVIFTPEGPVSKPSVSTRPEEDTCV